jgi:signal transduction histidine kinase
VVESEPERAKRHLWAGILVFRWAALGWMTVLALVGDQPLHRPEVAWASLGAVAGWSAWLTVGGGRQETAPARWFDLALAAALVLASGIIVGPGEIESDVRPFFAAAYPVSAALIWGAAGGPVSGLGAGAVLGLSYALSRPVNGVGLGELSAGQLLGLGSVAVNYLLAGGAMGVVGRLLDRSADQVRASTEELMRARERTARLAERESLARQIHDSVLQALALVHKRGKELGANPSVRGEEVRRLAEMAGKQEQQLRSLILREPEEPPAGMASLREALESVSHSVTHVPVTVTAVGPVWLPAVTVRELAAAVEQALQNVAEHAAATRATVYAASEDGWVVVTVRDDGRGFEYDEGRLRADGKAGILKSMKGRVEDLGGTLRVDSDPGSGTEIELRVPDRGRGRL